MEFNRQILPKIEENLFKKGKIKPAIVIYGPRQVGKTTLCKQIYQKFTKKFPDSALFYNCDYFEVQEQFAYKNATNLKKIIGNTKLLILDEAQRIKNIGLTLKILVDEFPHLQVIATGSSSFDLANEINEPLTGRKIEFKLFPLAFSEINQKTAYLERQNSISNLLRFGSYPLVIQKSETDAENYLKELTDSYLFKDILTFQNLRKPEMLSKLLRLLAFQIGQEVSFNELAMQLGIDASIVQKYIHLLEESFVIFRLGALSRNLRKEVSKTRKIYFWDLGIRNTLIQNLNPLDLRNDTGGLWENFCVVERLKKLEYAGINCNQYFWRTYEQKELDYIEEKGGKLNAFEFKWSNPKKVKKLKEFLDAYPGSTFKVITKENIDEFIQ